jgi:hypothetical protein
LNKLVKKMRGSGTGSTGGESEVIRQGDSLRC